jgi:hypothetical protein
LNSVSYVRQFVQDANSAFSGKDTALLADFRKTIKELSDAQRKKLLKIIENPFTFEDADVKSLQETISATRLSIEKGTFKTSRKPGLLATICRIWDNIFNNRTRSCLVEGAILAQKDFALITRIPENMILSIFALCKADLPALASVNRFWKRLTQSQDFYTTMFSPGFAARCFGKKDLKKIF